MAYYYIFKKHYFARREGKIRDGRPTDMPDNNDFEIQNSDPKQPAEMKNEENASSESERKSKNKRARSKDAAFSPEMLLFGKSMLLKLREAVASVLPVSAIVFVLCMTPIVDVTPKEAGIFAACIAVLILGIGLFNIGADLAMTPMGEQMGSGLTKTRTSLPAWMA